MSYSFLSVGILAFNFFSVFNTFQCNYKWDFFLINKTQSILIALEFKKNKIYSSNLLGLLEDLNEKKVPLTFTSGM